MKKLSIAILALLMVGTTMVSAQEVNTMYFLENTPMRHKINPAFQPVSRVYVGILPLHYMTLSAGNNALALNDLIYSKNNKLITGLYPGETDKLANRLKNDLRFTMNSELAILNFGARTKDSLGYFHVGLNARMEGTMAFPGDIYEALNSGLDNAGGRRVNLQALSLNMQLLAELSGGYSRKINDHWTVGGKLKFLYGLGFMDLRTNTAYLDMHPDELHAIINGDVNIAAPIKNLPERIDKDNINSLTNFDTQVGSILKPKGLGGALDLGFTYKPVEQFQLAVSVTDLGFVYWNSTTYSIKGDTTYTGPVMHYSEINSNTANEQNTGINAIIDTITTYATAFIEQSMVGHRTGTSGVARMTNTRLHIGVDGNFCDNKIGVGVYSQTQFRNRRVYEELTLGLSLRPVNWFNFALSYSFLNGRWNSIGAGLSIMPYDGLNLTVMTDYIPFTYADVIDNNGKSVTVPYKMKGLNVALGLTIVAGTNPSKPKKQQLVVPDRVNDVPTNTDL